MQTVQREWHLGKGDLKGAAAARHDFTRYLGVRQAGTQEAGDAALIFGELVNNAVRCARSYVSVQVLEDRWTTLRIVDDGECFNHSVIAPQPLEAESGRGLYIANCLARRLDISASHHRCEVNAVLPIRS